ncbi:PorV/PorQ family protein [Ancylomarina sp. 16SWW S1-10-2]|uniref:putative type IX sorting system protein PorV2 n=1 Tax=Ancylomarina sp. 16SWW S1-10-2 TaxID=2499681 RepID=UPI0012AD43AE|nr:PorV/PorQ family protein [Ancylomarina sp. 16SWW S1-10-2]MRT91521.1 PorV/PorQ family protein [Ancylomarina sp. 16SWW S1-10-2]
MQKYLIFLFFIISSYSLLGQTSAPKYSNEFLSVGIGARAFAMGNVAVASQEGVESAYWNPASLADLSRKYDLSAMHAEYFAGMAAYDYVGFGIKLDEKSALAFSVIRYGVDDIPNTLELIDKDGNIRYDLVTTFSAADYALLISYAKKTKIKGLSIGGNVKLIYRHTGDFASAYGFGIDAALKYKTGNWQMGALLRDASSTFNAWVFKTDDLEQVFKDTGNEIPENSTEITLPRLILGVSRDIRLTDKVSVLAELDADFTFDGERHTLIEGDPVSIDPHMGLEFQYQNLIYLRMGVGNIQRETDFKQEESLVFQPNMGLGIHYKNFRLDYALTDIGDQSISLYSNVFSLSYAFE